MLSLDQVHLLENHVEKAVSKITSLTAENERLRSQLSTLQERVRELEGFVTGFKDDQGKIEAGILNALEQLGALENTITSEAVQDEAADLPDDAAEIPDDAADREIADEVPPMEPGIPADTTPKEQTAPVQDDGQIDIF